MKVNLSVNVAGMALRNPIMTASGTFGYGAEFAPYMDLQSIGAIVTKGLSLRPQAGNDTPRIIETPAGMLNAIGLQNVGIDAFVEKKVPFLRTVNTPCIANFFGNTVEEYAEMARRLDAIPEVAGLEMNISCPNVKCGGIQFGSDPASAATVVAACRAVCNKPLIVKLSPNVTDVVAMARACVDAGADSLSLINTLVGMAIDIKTRRPVLANTTGGLSGPAIKPVALRMVWQVAQAVKVPLIGIGGIMSATDVVEFLPDGTPFPTFYYLTHPAAAAAMSALEAGHVMPEFAELLSTDEDVRAAYRAAHEAYLADRAVYGDVEEIAGISAGGMPERVKCLHALAGHALAAGPGVNPIGDLALARGGWSPERCACAPPAGRAACSPPRAWSRCVPSCRSFRRVRSQKTS